MARTTDPRAVPAPRHGAADGEAGPEEFDRELDLRAIVWTLFGVTAMTVVSAVAMWGMVLGFHRFDNRQPPYRSPIPEANRQAPPPEPRLQTSPPEDMRAMRESEDRILHHAAWADQRQGTVRLPIEVAIDVLARKGLPPAPPVAAPAGAASPFVPPSGGPAMGTPSQGGGVGSAAGTPGGTTPKAGGPP